MSQRKLGRLTGIPQAALSRLENDKRTPTEQEWRLLRQLLALPAKTPSAMPYLPSPSPSWRVPAPELSSAGTFPFSARAFRARQSFSGRWESQFTLVKTRDDAQLSLKFLNEAGLDSGPEAMYWVLGLAGGGRACWYAPSKAGFRKFPIVDKGEKRKVVSDVRHPCVELKRDGYEVLMFPQVRVVTRYGLYILDALVCVSSGDLRLWVNVEIDGAGHEGEFDQNRQAHLGLATIRLRSADLAKPDALAALERRLRELLEEKRAG